MNNILSTRALGWKLAAAAASLILVGEWLRRWDAR